MGANEQAFIDAFSDNFDAKEQDIADRLPSDATITGYKKDKIVAPYDIPVDAHDDFFSAYVAALMTAYRELVISNQELVSLIADCLDESLEEVYGFSD